MILGTFQKQPAESLDYDIEYGDWLPDTDSLSESNEPETTVTPSGLDILSTTRDYDNDRVKIWLEGGEDGEQYKVEVTTYTREGRARQDEFYILVRDF